MNKKTVFTFIILILLLFAVVLISLSVGSSGISFWETLKALFGKSDENTVMIIQQIRLPRVIMAVIAGAALAVSGCVFQGVLKNPLADPFTLGISGGAAFGATAAFVFGFAALSRFFVPTFAFAGALISVFIVYLLSSRKRFGADSMILSGVIISYIFSSAVMLLYALFYSNHIQAAFMWLMGNLSVVDERLLVYVSVIVIAGVVALCLCGNIINMLSLGGDKSKTLGVNVEKTTKILFLTASLITASVVSICGVIGFVGLMIPHIMRKISGGDNSSLIPVSAVAGAVFLLFCDTLSRVLFAPVNIPVGVITNIAGGAFFIFLLVSSKE
ncbi:MAG: iron ABC transporter permease [Endomicrobia bacterium]|nr:iron ABC transporter permease [Endomicrobiia bacterium]MCL2506619.1 iron ABC transporter permease [Endomicrobiia bacterium]